MKIGGEFTQVERDLVRGELIGRASEDSGIRRAAASGQARVHWRALPAHSAQLCGWPTPPTMGLHAALASERELGLMRRLAEFPEVLAGAADELAPHQVAFYLRELAADFHGYYNATRILVDEEEVKLARLALAGRRGKCCAMAWRCWV